MKHTIYDVLEILVLITACTAWIWVWYAITHP